MRQRCRLDISRSGMEAIRSTPLGAPEFRGENATNHTKNARYARIIVEYPISVAAWLQPTFALSSKPGSSVRFSQSVRFSHLQGAMP
jgi:hypothetical protein